jgi:hypothetical protein
MADKAATELRGFVTSLAAGDGRPAVAELQRRVGALLHDTTLQALEYLAADGYGADLSAETVRGVAGDTAAELRAGLPWLGSTPPCELIAGLEGVVSVANGRGTADVALEITEWRRVSGADAAALVGAAREALNNVHKHARASRVVVRCETAADGARVTISDDGVGADLDGVEPGLGLQRSILQRMTSAGGRADIDSVPGRGTLVTLTTGALREVAA